MASDSVARALAIALSGGGCNVPPAPTEDGLYQLKVENGVVSWYKDGPEPPVNPVHVENEELFCEGSFSGEELLLSSPATVSGTEIIF